MTMAIVFYSRLKFLSPALSCSVSPKSQLIGDGLPESYNPDVSDSN